MNNKIELLETAVGKPIEQWNVSDLEMFSLEENLELLQDPEVIDECMKRSQDNKEVSDVLLTFRVFLTLDQSTALINSLLADNESSKLSDEDLKTKTLELLDKDFITRLMAYIVIISKFHDIVLTEKEIELKEDVLQLKTLICDLIENNLVANYPVILRLNEIIWTIVTKYRLKYQADILDDEDHRLENDFNTLAEFERSVLSQVAEDSMNGELPEAIEKELNGETTDNE